LLRELVDLSILSLDRRSATYFPTARFARMASWLTDQAFQDPQVMDVLRDVQAQTQETATIAVPTDLCVELVAVERGPQAIAFIAEPGQHITFWGSAIGVAYLTSLQNSAIAARYDRCKRTGGEWAPRMTLAEVMTRVEQARKQGYAAALGAVFPDACAISMLLPSDRGVRQMVMSVAGPANRLWEAQSRIAGILHAAVERIRLG
jgi:IclR family transcriptional regulator, acetate operon repressor